MQSNYYLDIFVFQIYLLRDNNKLILLFMALQKINGLISYYFCSVYDNDVRLSLLDWFLEDHRNSEYEIYNFGECSI